MRIFDLFRKRAVTPEGLALDLDSIGLDSIGLEYVRSKASAKPDSLVRDEILKSVAFRRSGRSFEGFYEMLADMAYAANRGMLHFRDFGLCYADICEIYRFVAGLQPRMKTDHPLKLDKAGDASDFSIIGEQIVRDIGHLIDGEDASDIIYGLYGIRFAERETQKLIGMAKRRRHEIKVNGRIIEEIHKSLPTDTDSGYLEDCAVVAAAVAAVDDEEACKKLFKEPRDFSHVIKEYSSGIGKKQCRTDVVNKTAAYRALAGAGYVKRRKGKYIFNRDVSSYVGLDRNIAYDYRTMNGAREIAESYKERGIAISETTVRNIAKEVLGSEYTIIASGRKKLFTKNYKEFAQHNAA